MTKFSRNFLTRSTQSRQSYSKRLCKPALLLVAAALAGSCASPNLYPELGENKSILLRRSTFVTHPPFEAGDHGTEYSNPVFVENTLVFGSRSQGLTAIYPEMNRQRWNLRIKGGVVSEISVEKGTLYFVAGDGFLYSVSLDNGRVNWKNELRIPFASRPTVKNNRVFLTTTDDTVYAFDAGTGKWLWHYKRRSAQTSTIYGASPPLVDGSEVLAGLSDGFLVALSLEDGQLKWEKRLHTANKFTDVDAQPQLDNGKVYVPSYDGALYCLKRQGGEILWKFDAGGSKQVVVEDQRIFLPSSDGNIYALEKETAKVLWKFPIDQGTPTQLLVTDKMIYVGSSYQYFYAIDKNTGKGTYRLNIGTGTGFAGSIGYDAIKQRLAVLSSAGNLYTFDVRKTSKKDRPWGSTDPYL